VLEEADERVFGRLHTPEALRASIREVNEEIAAAKRAQSSAEIRDQTTAQEKAGADASNAGLDRARGDALENLLGAAAFREFESAEREALTRARERYPGWARRVGVETSTGPSTDFAAH
jgi:hypothetical protein